MCKNCGAWRGLHHYETQQCPKNGVEQGLNGKPEVWISTKYEEQKQDSAFAKRLLEINEILEAIYPAQKDESCKDLIVQTIIHNNQIIENEKK